MFYTKAGVNISSNMVVERNYKSMLFHLKTYLESSWNTNNEGKWWWQRLLCDAWTEMLKASTCKKMYFRFQNICFVFQYWTDFYLQWNISDYPGVSNVRFPYNQIWRPDVLLYNRYATILLQRNKRQSWLCKLTTEPPAAHHLSFYYQKLWYRNDRFELSQFWHPFLWHWQQHAAQRSELTAVWCLATYKAIVCHCDLYCLVEKEYSSEL